jgi:hypothetical protein
MPVCKHLERQYKPDIAKTALLKQMKNAMPKVCEQVRSHQQWARCVITLRQLPTTACNHQPFPFPHL